jgi:adhesin/invasin
LITFTTTLGRIEPAEARTSNGQVRVRLIAGNQSGVATVTAFSGGASGKIENLRVGSAAVERVLLSASPQTLGASGGTSTIQARVEDVSGAGVPGVPVTFTADIGSLSAGVATTDASGLASVTVTSSTGAGTPPKVTVTANVAGKTATVAIGFNPRTGLTLTAPTTNLTALQPASFTVAVAAGTNIRDVRVAWGDGSSQSLGALAASTTVSHIYQEAGNYTVTATATDASGFTETVSTSVTVLPAQPPSVIVSATPSNAALNQTVVVRAQVQGNSSAIVRYEWNFDAGAVPQTAVTTGNQVTVSWGTIGTKIIFVRAFQASGPSGDGFGAVNVSTTGGGTPVQGSK